MAKLLLMLLVTSFGISFSVLSPMKTPSGSIDFDSLLDHVRFLEKTVVSLKQDSNAQKTEITELKSKVAALEVQVGSGQLAAEMKYLKDELFGTKTELHSLSNDVFTASSGLRTMTSKYANIETRMNSTAMSMDHLKASAESGIQAVNTSLQTFVSSAAGELNKNKNSLQSIKKSLAAINASKCVNPNDQNDTKHLQEKTSKLQDELNLTVSTIGNLKAAVGYALTRLNTTEKEYALLRNGVVKMNNNVLNTVTSLQSISNTISRISSIVDRLNTEVSFEATSPSSHSARRIIRFTDVKHNVGGGYDPHTGKFIAPVTGVYLFWTQVEKGSGLEGRVVLYHNSIIIGYSYTLVHGVVTGTAISAARVAAGESVHVGTETTDVGDNAVSSFGGVLLRRH